MESQDWKLNSLQSNQEPFCSFNLSFVQLLLLFTQALTPAQTPQQLKTPLEQSPVWDAGVPSCLLDCEKLLGDFKQSRTCRTTNKGKQVQIKALNKPSSRSQGWNSQAALIHTRPTVAEMRTPGIPHLGGNQNRGETEQDSPSGPSLPLLLLFRRTRLPSSPRCSFSSGWKKFSKASCKERDKFKHLCKAGSAKLRNWEPKCQILSIRDERESRGGCEMAAHGSQLIPRRYIPLEAV